MNTNNHTKEKRPMFGRKRKNQEDTVAAPAPSAREPERSAEAIYARRLYLGVLVTATVVSVVGNVFYAVQAVVIAARAGGPVEMGEVASGIAHAVPPVLLLMVAEVLAVSMRVEPPVPVRERAEGENRVAAWFSAPRQAWSQRAVFAIMAASFALSAQALFMIGVWAHVPPWLAWLTPVMVDLTIVVCADKLWTLSMTVGAAQAVDESVHTVPAGADEAVQAEAVHGAQKGTAQGVHDVQPMTDEGVHDGTAQSPVHDVHGVQGNAAQGLAADDAHVVHASPAAGREAVRTDGGQAVPLIARSGNEVVHDASDGGARRERDGATAVQPMAVHGVQEGAAHGVHEVRSVVDEDVHDGAAQPVMQPVHDTPAQAPGTVQPVDVQEFVAALHGELNPTVPVEVFADALAQRAAGKSLRTVADAVGVSPNTVKKWNQLAAERNPDLAGQIGQGAVERQFAVVR